MIIETMTQKTKSIRRLVDNPLVIQRDRTCASGVCAKIKKDNGWFVISLSHQEIQDLHQASEDRWLQF